MEDRIVQKIGDLNIYGDIHDQLQKAGISHQRLAVSNIVGLFMELVSDWRSDPNKFKKQLKNLRNTALKPYLEDPDKFAEDITLINNTYAHIINYTLHNIDPVIDAYQLTNRRRRFQELEWVVKGTGGVAKATISGSFKHGVPISMIAFGGSNLIRISSVLAAAIDTINSYAHDPTGRCASINRHAYENNKAMHDYENALSSIWVKVGWNDAPNKPDIAQRGFFTSLADSAFCTLPQWTTGVAGDIFSGASDITGAATSTFAAFVILLLGVVLWLLLNRNSEFGIPFLAYFKFHDPDSKNAAASTHFIQQNVAPAITSGAVSPPKQVVKEVQRVENAASKAYVNAIENARTTSSVERIASATEASIEVIEEQSKRVSPVAKLILQSEIEDKQEEIRMTPHPLHSQIHSHNLRKTSPKRTSPKRTSPKALSFLEHIKSRPLLKPVGERKLKSPPLNKKNINSFNAELLNKLNTRRAHIKGEEDEDEDGTKKEWDFGYKKRKSRKISRSKKLHRSRKLRKSRSRSRKPRRSKKPRRSRKLKKLRRKRRSNI